MAFRAYELYYLDSYDEEVDDLVTMYDYDEDDYSFDDDIRWHIDDDYIIENGLRVAILIHDPDTHEIDCALLQPDNPRAPDWYGVEEMANVMAEVQRIMVAHDDYTVSIVPPQDPAFALTAPRVFPAEDLTAATVMMLGDSQDNAWYSAFCIEFTPNLKSDESFPVAVFVYDPRDNCLVSKSFTGINPFAPETFNRRQRRIVERKLDEIFAAIDSSKTATHPVSPFTNLGPQFRASRLPSVEAVGPDHALLQTIERLLDWWQEQAA